MNHPGSVTGWRYLFASGSTEMHLLLRRISLELSVAQKGASCQHNMNPSNLLQEGVGHGGGLVSFNRLL